MLRHYCQRGYARNARHINQRSYPTEDILLSYAYALHYGMEAIKITPGTIIYYKPQAKKIDKEKKIQCTQKNSKN